jgi:hypothetical protein
VIPSEHKENPMGGVPTGPTNPVQQVPDEEHPSALEDGDIAEVKAWARKHREQPGSELADPDAAGAAEAGESGHLETARKAEAELQRIQEQKQAADDAAGAIEREYEAVRAAEALKRDKSVDGS